jgi:TolB-like protein/DNA-binding winged helix-turn-helix (wHTH) protein/Tfp pilus assembly protein PilF
MRDVAEFDRVKPSREAGSVLRFAGLVLSLDACMLARDSGEAIPLTRGELAVLRMFAARPGRVISRDTLLDAFANRRFEPFDRSVDVLIGKLRRKIEADPRRPQLIVTVPGEGYRFDGLTRSLRSEQDPFVPASKGSGGRSDWSRESDPPLAEQPAALGSAGGAKTPMPEQREPPHLSLVVLPFANIGGGASQDYFVDGVTESLTTDLSRISGAFVIGRSTAFSYKDKLPDLRQIGRELNVRYVLEGSVQRGAGRMRVNVQLIKAETGAHLWAERFDKPVADLLDMQDEIVARLANQLKTELIAVEARRAEQALNLDSMDLYFQGRAILNRDASPNLLAKARQYFERALELDGGNVDALVGLGLADFQVGVSYVTDDPAPLQAAVETKLLKALAAAPNNAFAHTTMGYLLTWTNRAQRGIEEFERALALDPNLAGAWAGIGLAHQFIGHAEETEAHVQEALRLSPRDAVTTWWFNTAGGAKACLAEYDAAAAWLRKSVGANRSNPLAYFTLAACLAHLGRLEDARQEVKAGLAVNPKFAIRRFRAGVQSDNPVYLAQRERIVEGLRWAGVPEG